MSQLDSLLLAAHEEGNKRQLVLLYKKAAKQAETPDARGFFLTHAYIFALECGHPDATSLHAMLKAEGREE